MSVSNDDVADRIAALEAQLADAKVAQLEAQLAAAREAVKQYVSDLANGDEDKVDEVEMAFDGACESVLEEEEEEGEDEFTPLSDNEVLTDQSPVLVD